jgi:uncharacterized protein YcbK (DUF882 family)
MSFSKIEQTQLTPHFHLSEFIRAEDPFPNAEVLDHLQQLAQRLQTLRDLINLPIRITSGYRSREHNLAVGGKPDSYHLKGMAADIVIDGISARKLQQQLIHWSGGLGCYQTFTHVDIRPKKARWNGTSG